MDENLAMIGARLTLPPAATATQRESWKSGGREPGASVHAARSTGGLVRRRPYVLAGSALAAAVALAAFLATPTQHSTVEAATIWRTFRESVHRGLRVTLADIGADEVQVDGHLNVLFKHAINLGQLFGDNQSEDLPIEAVSGELNVTCGAEAEPLAGLKLLIALGLSKADQWIYLRSEDPTPLTQVVGPFAALIFRPLRDGLLLDLKGTLDLDALFDPPPPELVAPDVPPADAEPSSAENSSGSDATALVRNFLAGQASTKELEALAAQLEQAAREVRVDQRAPGVFVLVARDFAAAADAADEATPQWLSEMSLEIAYREGVGIEWATLSNVGDRRGRVQIEFIAEPTAADRLERARYVQDGVTTVVDVAALENALEALFGTTPTDGNED
jgi:hypothetical protein